MKKFFGEFKKFITRGNVLDMAVGVIVGGAFTAIVNALSNHILKPIINWLLALIFGANSLNDIYTFLKPVYTESVVDGKVISVIDLEQSIYIDWGAFINAIINFILIAFVLFSIVKAINYANEGMKKGVRKYEPLTKDEIAAYKREGKKRAEIMQFAKEKQAAIDLEKQQAEEEALKNAPKTETQLLEEIAELLRSK